MTYATEGIKYDKEKLHVFFNPASSPRRAGQPRYQDRASLIPAENEEIPRVMLINLANVSFH